jgi:hypothetical protein
MSGQQRLRQPTPPPTAPDDLSAVVARLADSFDALNVIMTDPKDGLKAKIGAIETRVLKNEGKLDVVLRAFRLDGDHRGQPQRRYLGMSRATVLGIVGALIVGFCTGPVGYYVWFKVLPAAIHGALTVAP